MSFYHAERHMSIKVLKSGENDALGSTALSLPQIAQIAQIKNTKTESVIDKSGTRLHGITQIFLCFST